MIVLGHERERTKAMFPQSPPIAWAGLLALALSFPGSAIASDNQPTVIVVSNANVKPDSAVLRNARQTVMGQLMERGYTVHHGPVPQTIPTGHSPVVLRISAVVQRLTGTYTKRAGIRLSATLEDGLSKRQLGHFDSPASAISRIASSCTRICQERLFIGQVRQLSDALTARIHKRLARLPVQQRHANEKTRLHSVAFRGIEEALLPQIEQYLRHFPGLREIHRDRKAGNSIRYRYRQSESPQATELSLRKMLHHLQLNAQLQKIGNSFVVTAIPAIGPAIHPRDW